MSEVPMKDPELMLLLLTASGAHIRVQDLVQALRNGTPTKQPASAALKSIELLEVAIEKAKTPIRRLIRKK